MCARACIGWRCRCTGDSLLSRAAHELSPRADELIHDVEQCLRREVPEPHPAPTGTRTCSSPRRSRPGRRWPATALALQRSLLPRSTPAQSAVEVACRYQPAATQLGVGGDWYDIIPLSGARVALVVGDVVGHGIHAAATMGRLRTAVRTLARHRPAARRTPHPPGRMVTEELSDTQRGEVHTGDVTPGWRTAKPQPAASGCAVSGRSPASPAGRGRGQGSARPPADGLAPTAFRRPRGLAQPVLGSTEVGQWLPGHLVGVVRRDAEHEQDHLGQVRGGLVPVEIGAGQP